MYRITKRSLNRIQRDRANSCPDLVLQVDREFEEHSNSGWRYTTAREHLNPIPDHVQTNQQTQTEIPQPLRVKDAQVHSTVHLLTAVTVIGLTQTQT